MEVISNQSRWYDRVLAAFIFFTRLPWWRWHQPPKECYSTVVEHWPLTGWLTASVMAATLYFGSWVLPYSVSVALAIAARMLLTGALHEDGLADFADGFGGGGGDRQRTLDIMKDSHIGTYGVLALALYLIILWSVLCAMPAEMASLTILAVDPYAKMVAAQIVIFLPYARNEEQAKSKVVYRRMPTPAAVSLAIQGLLPLGLYLYYMGSQVDWQMVVFIPCITMFFLYRLMLSRLRGYTGDCCGALFLLVELTAYLMVV